MVDLALEQMKWLTLRTKVVQQPNAFLFVAIIAVIS